MDITIDGGNGFYSICAQTKAGRKWMRRNVQGTENGSVYTDQTDYAQDIAEGAFGEDLKVEVNGKEYLGNGVCAQ